MLSIHTDQNIVYTVADGHLENEDYERLLPLLQEKLETYDKIRWYFEMKNFEGWSPAALWKDLKFDFQNRDRLEKIAMVGDQQWEEVLTQMMKPFTPARIAFFETDQREEALNWIEKSKVR